MSCIILSSLFISFQFSIIYAQTDSIYGIVSDKLIKINTHTGNYRLVSSIKSLPEGSFFEDLTFNSNNKLFYTLLKNNSLTYLASVTLKGNLSIIGELSYNGSMVKLAEALSFNSSDNNLYASVSLDGGIEENDFLARYLVIIFHDQIYDTMKRFIYILALPLFFFLNGCITEEGPQGPPGPQGPQGPAGEPGEIGIVFEFENINFTAPAYEVLLEYPDDFEGLASDVALVYLLWGVENVDGEDLEVWRQLPQSILTEHGLLLYNYDFTKNDVKLFLDGEFPLDLLSAMDTDEWVARIVIVPGEFWASARLDSQIEYNELKSLIGLTELPVHHQIQERRELIH